ncbi:hypothetical protein F511_25338 [Dorcoceras hygrometricum]|uniref:Uncharacterized protein n=1 Tax=Dorcoceras hygrometricum TaxID=472368 RepID=A0A2Z7A9U4_9LAMI|nr:hypothetical protein F511_25338 [Dorcoceras hygrometricum]
MEIPSAELLLGFYTPPRYPRNFIRQHVTSGPEDRASVWTLKHTGFSPRAPKTAEKIVIPRGSRVLGEYPLKSRDQRALASQPGLTGVFEPPLTRWWSPSGAVATGLLCNMISDRDIARLRSATNSEVVGLFAAQLAALADLEAVGPRRKGWQGPEGGARGRAGSKKATRAYGEAFATEKRAMGAELEALLAKKTAVEVELDETKARVEAEIGRLRSEATNSWDLGKEEFLKSSEFDNLCTKKSLTYFEIAFQSCVAQFRANGYFEEEHPAPFLSVTWALDELPNDDEKEADEGNEEEDDECATPPSPPKQ